MEVVEAEEECVRQEEEAEQERRRNMDAHRRAGVLALDDGSLLARMFRGDKDMGVLLQLPGAHTLMTKCVFVCDWYKTIGMPTHVTPKNTNKS